MKVAILSSPNQWFIPYAKALHVKIPQSKLFYSHHDMKESFDIVFILSYHKIIEAQHLQQHKHNIVIHASDLPMGKGWSPLFWQILEGKNDIPFSMFEVSSEVDAGDIYMQKILHLNGYELHDEIRDKQANFTIEMCLEYLRDYQEYKNPKKQSANESFYPKRSSKDSQLDINKTIKEQFNLLRITSNEEYPAFFEIEGKRYSLKIQEINHENS